MLTSKRRSSLARSAFARSLRVLCSLVGFVALAASSGACSSSGSASTSGSSGSTSSGAGGGGSSGCDQIESDYLMTATSSSATTCAAVADCDIDVGLCKKDGSRVIGNAKGVYNTATVKKLKQLADEWTAQSCGAPASTCNGSAGGSLDCNAGTCTAI